MFSPIPNNIQQALARLLTQYSNAPNLQGLLKAMLSQIQGIEQVLTDMNNLRYIPNAMGAQLDLIGALVGIKRPPGASDAVYLQLIQGQIAINTSDGQPENAIQVFLLFTQTSFVFFYEEANAGVLMEGVWVPPNQAAVDSLITTLQNTLPAGVRCDGIVQCDETIPFAYDGIFPGAGYDDGSQIVGGKYAKLWEYKGPGFAYAGADRTGQGYGTLFDPLAGGSYLT